MNGLGINAWFLGSQIVSFLILYYILRRWVFPAIMNTLDQRAQRIREGIENADKAEKKLAEAEIRVNQMLDDARKEAAQTIAQATTAAQHVRDEIVQAAQQRRDEIVQQAQVRIQQEEAQARAELRRQVADISIRAAGRVIGASLDDARHRRLVEDFVSSSKDL
jgi:F-type H+-transporting ATPase subunit b